MSIGVRDVEVWSVLPNHALVGVLHQQAHARQDLRTSPLKLLVQLVVSSWFNHALMLTKKSMPISHAGRFVGEEHQQRRGRRVSLPEEVARARPVRRPSLKK